MDRRVLVIGAGLGGLTTALALLQRGIEVAVYEEAPVLGEVGAGISIQANARQILASLGLIEPLREVVVTPDASANRHYQTGEPLHYWPYTGSDWEIGGPFVWFLHRADLHAALVDAIQALDPGCLQVNARLVEARQDGDGVEAVFADGSTVRGAALIGCDGIRSATREALFGEETPQFTGIVAWRGLVPIERLPAGIPNPTNCTWSGPDRHFTSYPVRARTLVNYVAFAGNKTWQVEGWKVHSEVSELLAEFEGWDRQVLEIIGQTPPELCYKWALYDRDPLPSWVVDRIALLGDAAHPMLPFLGQAACLAMEDGLVLARCLADEPDIMAALRRYERARQPRADEVQILARANGVRLFDHNPEERLADGSYTRAAASQLALREYDATTVAV